MVKTLKEINKEAKQVLKDVFSGVLKSEDKQVWRDAMMFVSNKIQPGTDMRFVWEKVRIELARQFGLKFIVKK